MAKSAASSLLTTDTTDFRGFVHLHLHSEYSLLDGANRVDKLIKRVKELGMDAVAVTDHGNMHGAYHFYNKAKAADIKPIMGIEAYVAPGDRTDRTHTGVADGGFHLVLLAENNTGYHNLLKLTSDAYLNGFYYKPRMDKSTLTQYADGLIAINGHLGSSLAHHLVNFTKTKDKSEWQKAIAEAKWHAETFKPNENGEPRFYIEIQRHINEQEVINPLLVKLAHELNLPLVCDNDSHFLLADDHDAHDSLICISTGKTKDETQRMKYPPDLYVKSPEEMAALFSGYLDGAGDEALLNTRKIADRCNVKLESANHAPVVRIVYRSGATPLPQGGERLGEGVDASPNSASPSPQPSASEGEGVPHIADSQAAMAFIKQFKCDHPLGSTDWFKAFCAQFELLPYDSQNDTENAEELKTQCDSALRLLAEAGAIWRYGTDASGGGVDDEKRKRIERELQVLADKLISAYFLMVWDFVNWARQRGIPSNARGSGVGTMVGYVLGLSNACPVHYGLLFERFTDPDRAEYPDIDIDICQDGRGAVINYVREKYGHVAQIITFGTLKARAAIRDVGRVLNIPLAEVDRLAKLIPEELGITLDDALKKEPDLKKEYDNNDLYRKLIDTSRRLEGMARHASVHAAGVVVATQPLDNIVPLCKASSSDDIVTQWDGPTCEKVGLLKMDFLGLRTLSTVQRAIDLIQQTLTRETQLKAITGGFGQGPVPDSPREFGMGNAEGGMETATGSDTPHSEFQIPHSVDPLDMDRLTYIDQNVLDLFRRGETKGVFQFESGGMRDLLMAMRPDRLEDLIAANALYRPGPMDLIPDYNARKHGRAATPKVHEIVDRLTEETHGIMVYQEQVMQVVNQLGDIPLRSAYTLIKAISKKNEAIINANRAQFIEGAGQKGLNESQAGGLFDLILKFAGYGFNKSHSTGYAIVAYQTAFLKTYFPVQYMAALLTYEMVSTDKIVEYMDECRRVTFPDGHTGIDVRPPDINQSYTDFTVVFGETEPRDPNHGHIRFGLGAVKGVGKKAVETIIEARKAGPFKSLFDFCERVPSGAVNKGCLEAMIKCGAFDSLHGADKRAAMIAAVESAINRGAQEADLRSSDDFLFGAVDASTSDIQNPTSDIEQPQLPPVSPWDRRHQLEQEKSVLGFYVSAHPLDQYRQTIDRFTNIDLKSVRQLKADVDIIIGGMFTRVRQTLVKNGRSAGQKMAMFTIEDRTGSIDGVVFSETYARFSHLIQNDQMVFIKGQVDRRREEPSIRVDQVIAMDEAAGELATGVRIVLPELDRDGRARNYNGELNQVHQMLRTHPGQARLYLEIHEQNRIVTLATQMYIKGTADLPERIDTVLQLPGCCQLLGPDKIKVTNQNLATEANRVVNRLDRNTMNEDGACESIDRY